MVFKYLDRFNNALKANLEFLPGVIRNPVLTVVKDGKDYYISYLDYVMDKAYLPEFQEKIQIPHTFFSIAFDLELTDVAQQLHFDDNYHTPIFQNDLAGLPLSHLVTLYQPLSTGQDLELKTTVGAPFCKVLNEERLEPDDIIFGTSIPWFFYNRLGLYKITP